MACALVSGFPFPAEMPLSVSAKAYARDLIPNSGAPASFADLAEKLGPTVVNIRATKVIKSRSIPNGDMPFPGNDDFFRRFFGDLPERELRQKSLGSGFIISSDGYIFTNNHVVEKAEKIRVKLSNGKEYDAEVKGRDPNTDIALIKIKADKALPYATLGNSDKLRVGEWVFAIGNPFGLDHTVTAGIISAKGRIIGSGPYDNFLQTDASINPGNSGGPLFNMAGDVVGINTAIVAQGQGIGFAIPINMAKEILTDLKSKGRVTRGWLGITVQDITEEIATNMKLKNQKGALVSQVLEGEPGDKAGMKSGDVIINIDGKAISDAKDLTKTVAGLKVGKKVQIKTLREGKEILLSVIIGERKDTLTAKAEPIPDQLGMTVQEVTPEIERRLGRKVKGNVIITRVRSGSPADEAGLKVLDIILQINKTTIRSMKDYQNIISRKPENNSWLMLIQRGGTSFFVTLEIEKKNGKPNQEQEQENQE
jgi:serine protease Do